MTRARTMSLEMIGVLATAGLVLVTIVIFSGAYRAPFEGGDVRVVTVDFETAAQLHKGDQVRMEGNVEGKVTDIEPAPEPEEARATLEVEPDAGPIYADARARLRAKTLLAGAFYVDLDRGTKGAGPLGERVITTDRTSVQVEVEDVTDIFRDGAVTGFQTLPGEFATALSEPESLPEALRVFNRIAEDAGTAVNAARGTDPGHDLPELVSATAKTVEALDTPTDRLRTVVSGAAATLEVTGRRSAELRQTIDAGPAVTSDLTTTLARLDGTLDNARGLVARLLPAAPALAPTLAELRPTLVSTDALLDHAKPLVRALRPTISSLARTGGKGVPLVDGLKPSLNRVGDNILPYFARKDPETGKSTTVMIGGTAAGFGGASAQQDLNGHFIRFPASVGRQLLLPPLQLEPHRSRRRIPARLQHVQRGARELPPLPAAASAVIRPRLQRRGRPVMMLDPRERITEGVTRERLKMEAKRSAFPSLFFFGGIVVTLAIVAFLLANISETFGHKTYQVRLAVANDYGVFEGFDDVRFRGVPAGTITKVERRGSRLVLLAELQEKYGPIYRDARAEIRPITPLNDVYLDIVDPGSPEAGKADADQPLDESQTATSVSVPEVLDALGPDERVGVYRLLDQLGNGMDDGGVRLRRAFALLAPFLEEAGDLARQVAAREHATKRLIHNTAVLTTELGRREEDLKRLVETGAATLGTLHDGSADLDATLGELGPTFSELRASLASVRVVLADVDRGVTSLYPVAERLPQGLSSVRALNATLGPAVRNLRPAVRRLVPLARALRPASREPRRQLHGAAAAGPDHHPPLQGPDRLREGGHRLLPVEHLPEQVRRQERSDPAREPGVRRRTLRPARRAAPRRREELRARRSDPKPGRGG